MNRCSKSLFQVNLIRNSQPLRLIGAYRSQILSAIIQNSFRGKNININRLSFPIDPNKSYLTSYQSAFQNLSINRNLSKGSRKNTVSKYSDKKDHKKNILSSKDRFLNSVKKTDEPIDLTKLFKPVKILPVTGAEESNEGEELTGKLDKNRVNNIFIRFKEDSTIKKLSAEKGINGRMFDEAAMSFRRYCVDSATLDTDLHIKLYDISLESGNLVDLFPYFYKHAIQIFPHLNCMDDLKELSDLSEPSNWYPKAREIKRKIIYHAGPTNSGKTYSALKSFQNSKSGIYCGPLKLLANEIFIKTNEMQTKCDLVTGEERRYADLDRKPAEHLSCTVEMVNLDKHYEVAVIDEIQMISDLQRGWAWTRAFLGLIADEIHICGDGSAVELISDLTFLTNDTFEVRKYDRLTELKFLNQALESLENVEPGDCFVCFNKNDIFTLNNMLEKMGHDVAVIYGAMPAAIKMAQAKKFNDPNHKCKVLVATDAIGMGLNLNIRRIIFYTIKKPQMIDNGEKRESHIDFITTSQALQISGRAGRFNTAFPNGYVTTFKKNDLPILLDILKQRMERTKKAGLHPTAEQIELFAYQLPNHSLSDLIKIFTAICKIDNTQYILCNFDEIRTLAEAIDHIPIPIKAKYTFATSPISQKNPFIFSNFVKFVRSYSNNEVFGIQELKSIIQWPLKEPTTLMELNHLENVYDLMDLYLWLGFRFPTIFADNIECMQIRAELEEIIFKGVQKLLTKNNINNMTNKFRNMNIYQTKNEIQEIEQKRGLKDTKNLDSAHLKKSSSNENQKLEENETFESKEKKLKETKELNSSFNESDKKKSETKIKNKLSEKKADFQNNPIQLRQSLQSLIKNQNIQKNFNGRVKIEDKD